jgi:hypothetical protein
VERCQPLAALYHARRRCLRVRRRLQRFIDYVGSYGPAILVKGDGRYRYYVSRSLMKGPAARVDCGCCLAAAEIERSGPC